MKKNQIGDKVKFQPAEGFPISDGYFVWDAGNVKFIYVPTMAKGQLVRVDVEVTKEFENGIFRRAENFKLEKMNEDVLCTLRKSTEEINHT